MKVEAANKLANFLACAGICAEKIDQGCFSGNTQFTDKVATFMNRVDSLNSEQGLYSIQLKLVQSSVNRDLKQHHAVK